MIVSIVFAGDMFTCARLVAQQRRGGFLQLPMRLKRVSVHRNVNVIGKPRSQPLI